MSAVAAEPYDEFERHCATVRSVTQGRECPVEAIAAARRVFNSDGLIGLGRQKLVALVGEPYRTRARRSREKLIYRFDDGYGRYEYIVRLEHATVISVKERAPH